MELVWLLAASLVTLAVKRAEKRAEKQVESSLAVNWQAAMLEDWTMQVG